MITKRVSATFSVVVKVDETKFTPEFMDKFNEMLYYFPDLDDHIKHLAILTAMNGASPLEGFIEGYGEVTDMGISTSVVDYFGEIDFECEG